MAKFSGDSVVSGDSTIRHIPKFGGDLWFVRDSISASGDGMSPDNAFKTIGEAITAAAAGDAITIMAGNYTENGLDVNKNNLELWFEIGAQLSPTSGNALTVSGNFCRVTCEGGALKINPVANTTGVVVSGNFCYLNEIRVAADGGTVGTSGDIGFDITGDGADLRRCRCSGPDIAAFKIQGDKVKLENCCTGGNAGYSSIGFWVTNSCEKSRLKECGSQGHETAGFQFDVGCTNGLVCGGSSGGGDGKFVNNATTTNCIFSDMHFQGDSGDYNSPLVKVVTFTATGGVDGDGLHYRLFKVAGSSQVVDISGQVVTALPATSTVPNLELTSTNASIEITDDGGGPNISGAVVGAILYRGEEAAEPLKLGNPDNTPAVIESDNFRTPKVPIMCIEDDAADTYITLRLTVALASGAMLWACRYEPVSADGVVEPA